MLGNETRVELLRRTRVLQRVRDGQMTPAARLAVARRLHELATEAGTASRGISTDEPPERWLELIARLRAR